jgi:predicted Zn-dependent protease
MPTSLEWFHASFQQQDFSIFYISTINTNKKRLLRILGFALQGKSVLFVFETASLGLLVAVLSIVVASPEFLK